RRMRLLPQALQVRGDAEALRAPGGRRGDAAGAQTEARGAPHASLTADYHHEAVGVVAPGESGGANAELPAEPRGDLLSARRVVDKRFPVVVALFSLARRARVR